jgi:hypothetical protein
MAATHGNELPDTQGLQPSLAQALSGLASLPVERQAELARFITELSGRSDDLAELEVPGQEATTPPVPDAVQNYIDGIRSGKSATMRVAMESILWESTENREAVIQLALSEDGTSLIQGLYQALNSDSLDPSLEMEKSQFESCLGNEITKTVVEATVRDKRFASLIQEGRVSFADTELAGQIISKLNRAAWQGVLEYGECEPWREEVFLLEHAAPSCDQVIAETVEQVGIAPEFKKVLYDILASREGGYAREALVKSLHTDTENAKQILDALRLREDAPTGTRARDLYYPLMHEAPNPYVRVVALQQFLKNTSSDPIPFVETVLKNIPADRESGLWLIKAAGVATEHDIQLSNIDDEVVAFVAQRDHIPDQLRQYAESNTQGIADALERWCDDGRLGSRDADRVIQLFANQLNDWPELDVVVAKHFRAKETVGTGEVPGWLGVFCRSNVTVPEEMAGPLVRCMMHYPVEPRTTQVAEILGDTFHEAVLEQTQGMLLSPFLPNQNKELGNLVAHLVDSGGEHRESRLQTLKALFEQMYEEVENQDSLYKDYYLEQHKWLERYLAEDQTIPLPDWMNFDEIKDVVPYTGHVMKMATLGLDRGMEVTPENVACLARHIALEYRVDRDKAFWAGQLEECGEFAQKVARKVGRDNPYHSDLLLFALDRSEEGVESLKAIPKQDWYDFDRKRGRAERRQQRKQED